MTDQNAWSIDPQTPHVILYGLDADGRTRAGLFRPREAELAKQAATSMKFNFVLATSPDLVEIATKLKLGTVYRRGSSFLPVVRRVLYDRIVSVAGRDITSLQDSKSRNVIAHAPPRTVPRELKQDQDADSKSVKPTAPSNWKSIRAGDLVIAQANEKDGWWEAIVIAARDDDVFIKWRDYPRFRQVKRKRLAVALLHPKNGQFK